MESVTRWIFIAVAGLLAWIYIPKIMNGGKDAQQPIGPGITETAEYAVAPGKTSEQPKCEINGNHFTAVLSSRGASLVDLYTTGDHRYTEGGKPIEITTVAGSAWDRFALGFDWRALGTTGEKAQVAHDVVDWQIAEKSDKSCTFSYADDKVKLSKTISAGLGPYELTVKATIENVSDTARVHRLGVENTAWRTHKETDSHFGRQSPFATEIACGHDGGKLDRKSGDSFAAKDFEKPEFERGWFMERGKIDFAATGNAYFAQAVVPIASPAPPACGLQVEERWDAHNYADKTKDEGYGSMYRSRLIYPAKELAPHESATYEVAAYYGPKDRDALHNALGGQHHLSELINLGMFAVVSKVLVMFLIKAHDVIGNWGISIIVLTICVRLLLFPLTWKQIKSMVSMRRLKPEVDEINAKFKDDPQQKQVAMMEVYRKNGVNPLSGCLPVVVQMPVWWALYSVLQTAIELYHTPFLWFQDLSAPDPFFILPVVIGAMSFVQQKLMPQQVDMAQQKMMLYFMPAVFTVMMLFLPSGLGIYMLTNSILGIVQQQAVERFAPKAPSIEVREKDDSGSKSGGKKDQRKLSSTLPAK
ncbi:MAG TPA: membrane protein insertase YidC [Polyangiaceae bacterium]|nr:membrane protein insertase YidC [Polyangiaceae bacterium]